MVEVAFVLPIFFLLVFAIVQFSIVFFGYSNATYASQVAIHYAVTHGGDSSSPCTAAQLSAMVSKYLWGAPTGGTAVSVTWSPDNYAGSTVQVQISIRYPTGIPFSSLQSVQIGTSTIGTILY